MERGPLEHAAEGSTVRAARGQAGDRCDEVWASLRPSVLQVFVKRSEKTTKRRGFLISALSLAVLALAVVLLSTRLLPTVLHDRVAQELAASGFSDARFDLHFGFGGLWLENVVLAPDLEVERIRLDLDLLGPRPSAITLRGAHFESSLATLGDSSIARLVAGAESSEGSDPPPIRIERSSIELFTDAGASVAFRIDGEVHPATGRARFQLGSPLGEHTVALRWRDSEQALVAALHARGGGDEIDADARLAPGGALSVRAQVALAPGIRRWASHRVATDGLSASGSLALSGRAPGEKAYVQALDLRIEGGRVAIDGFSPVDVSVEAFTRDGAIRWEASARGDEGVSAHAAGSLGLEPADWEPAFAWTIATPLSAEQVNRAATFFAVEGDPRIRLSGHARREKGERWSLDSVRGQVWVETFRMSEADLVLTHVRAELAGRARIGPGGHVEVELDEGSRLESAAFHLDALHLDALETSLPLRIVHDDAGGLRVHAQRPLELAMARLAVGEGERALGFEDVSMTLAPKADAPIGTSHGDTTRLEASMRATASRLAGLLSGRRARARAGVEVAIEGEEKPRIDIPLEVHAAQLAEPESEASLRRAKVTLPLRWRRGELSADGRMLAEQLSWREIPIGPTSGAVRLIDDVLRLDWRGPASSRGAFTLAARLPLDEGRGSVRIRVPRTEIDEQAPLSRVLASLTDMRIVGTVEGELRLTLDAPERGQARLSLHGARVREVEGAGEGRGVHGELRFARLSPLETTDPAQLSWEHLEIGGVKLDQGKGQLAFAPPGDVIIRDVRARFAGGELEAAPFRFAWKAPDVPLDLRLRGIDLKNVLEALTKGRITGQGKLDGRVALRVKLGDERRLSLGDGHLISRGSGGLQLHIQPEEASRELGLEDLVDGSFLRRRVIGAMEDFEYRSLTMNLSDEGTKHVQARVVGRGKRMPQELDLTLKLRGIQPLLDRAIRLWPERISIEVGQK